jgi:hypothetical protein
MRVRARYRTSPDAHSGTLIYVPVCAFGYPLAYPFAHLGSRGGGWGGWGGCGADERGGWARGVTGAGARAGSSCIS